jgi:hypothetical protein
MHIDSYQFGRIIIDGTEYSSDLIIADGHVQADWWRKDGHVLSPEDLDAVVAANSEVLVVGCGAYGIMKVAEATRHLLEKKGIQIEALKTDEAVERFNELAADGKNVAAGLHLTC